MKRDRGNILGLEVVSVEEQPRTMARTHRRMDGMAGMHFEVKRFEAPANEEHALPGTGWRFRASA